MDRFSKTLVLKPRGLPPMPSATYFLSTAKKSKQKMPLSCAEGLGTARAGYNCSSSSIAFVVGRHESACEVRCKMDVGCETDLRAVRDGFR